MSERNEGPPVTRTRGPLAGRDNRRARSDRSHQATRRRRLRGAHETGRIEPVLQVLVLEAEDSRRPRDVPAGVDEDFFDALAFEPREGVPQANAVTFNRLQGRAWKRSRYSDQAIGFPSLGQ